MKAITEKYEQLGGHNSFLRQPIEDEHSNPDGIGRCRHFEDGAIYWHPEIGAYEVHGAINAKWIELGGLSSALGYPTSDELISGDGRGRCSCFQKGRIYWTPEAGTWSTDLHSDKAVLDWIAFNAKPLPDDWLAKYKDAVPPTIVDYSADINFTRNQGTKTGAGYGCMTYTLLHVVDILKDWEHPYTPAVSWHYAEWYWWEYHLKNPTKGVPLSVLANQGFASEGRCPTNWDTKFQWKKDASGNFRQQWEEPSQAAKNEVSLNQVKIQSDNNWRAVKPGNPSPSVEEIKQFLRSYGPIWCCGSGHAKAIVGYDDGKQQFKILDSYVHAESVDGGRNITYIPYSQVQPSGSIAEFSEVFNVLNERRITGQYAYSARIRIENNWRGTYTVSVGVEGKQPLVVWTTRGRNRNNFDVQHETPLETSKVLAIDVPLPDYAASYWPPSSSHRWFLKVEDHDRDSVTGKITEFTLARRYVDSDCYSVGRYRTETFGQPISIPVPDPTTGQCYSPINPLNPPEIPNPNPGTATVYVPASGTVGPFPPFINRFSISLTGDATHSPAGKIMLSGQLQMTLPIPRPMVNQKVELFELDPYAINKPSKWWVLRNSTNTKNDGTFQFEVKAQPSRGLQTYAVAFSDQGQILASSNCLVIEYSLLKILIRQESLPDAWAEMWKLLSKDI